MTYRFGQQREFVLDCSRRTLRRGADLVPVERRVFDLLRLLVEKAGCTVARESIYAELWRDTFVTDASLRRIVSLLRKALEPPARARALVETVHGAGYRLASVVEAADTRAGEGEVRGYDSSPSDG